MTTSLSLLKKQSRFAALLYFLGCLPAPFALLYVPGVLVVRGDAIATANNVRNAEALLRLGMGVELLSATIALFALLAFYNLFQAVSGKLARAMLVLFLISIPISYLNVLNDLAALTFARGPEFLSSVPPPQRDALVLFFLRLHNQGVILAQIFWGLWLFPFGMLIIRSGFVPRFVGASVMIAGFGYVVASSAILLLPGYGPVISDFGMILGIGELAILWMMIWGAREQTQPPASQARALA